MQLTRCLYVGRGGGWLRLWPRGPGLSLTASPPLFSERYGYRKPIVRLGRWRLFRLAKEKR